MSYDAIYEASRGLPVERIAKQLEDFAATGQDLSRRRFSRSPPPVPSVPSTTLEESSPPSPATLLHDKEIRELRNSIPRIQFFAQVRDELDRIRAAVDKGLVQQNGPLDREEAAKANIKHRWIKQGIWDKQWSFQPGDMWKHELPDSLPTVEASNSVSDGERSKSGTKRKRQPPYIDEEYEEPVGSTINSQDRQMSRPCYQFLHHFCQEREWIKMGLSNQYDDQNANLDSRAYDIVKSRWNRDGLWDEDWRCIPGTLWRHERPPKYIAPYEEYRKAAARKAAIVEQAERPPRWYFIAPVEYPPIMSPRFSFANSPDLTSNPFEVDELKSGSQATPSQGERSAISRKRGDKAAKASTHESAVQGKPSTTRREPSERWRKSAAGKPAVPDLVPTQVKPTTKPRAKQTFSTKRRGATEPTPAKRSSSTIHKKELPSKSAAKKEDTSASAKASRPRRAAAVKAMQNLKKTARR